MAEPISFSQRQIRADKKTFQVNHGGLAHTVWSLRLGEGEGIDLPLDRNAWKQVMAANNKPQAGDIIEVRTHDDSQFWSLFVQGAGAGWLKATLVQQTQFEAIPELPESSLLAPRWNVGARAYDVIRKADKTVIQSGIKLKEDAVKWIENHQRQMAA